MEIREEKYSEESLRVIFSEGDKQLSEIVKGFREITNKSYFAIGIYFSVISYAFLKSLELNNEPIQIIHITLMVIMIVPVGFIIPNIYPAKIVFVGAQPKNLIHEAYEESVDDQTKNIISQRVMDLQLAIENNATILRKRSRNLRWSITLAFASLIVCFGLWLFL